MPETRKRETAYKVRIGDLLRGTIIFEDENAEIKKIKFVELGNKQVLRTNIICNVIDKYENSGERKFASLTLDDGSGQIKTKVFGDDLVKFSEIGQGDTVALIGLLRFYNQELYLLPEIIKKTSPKYLLIRKLELDKQSPVLSNPEQKQKIRALRDEIIELIKAAEAKQGIDKEEIIMTLKQANPEIISQEIKKLLEEGVIYEPRPGRVRYLG